MFDFLYISKYISIKFLHLWGLIMSCDSGRLDYSSKVLTFVVYNSGVAYMCPAGSPTDHDFDSPLFCDKTFEKCYSNNYYFCDYIFLFQFVRGAR